MFILLLQHLSPLLEDRVLNLNQFVIELLGCPNYLIIQLSFLLILQQLSRVLERTHLYYLDHVLILPHEFDVGVGFVGVGEACIGAFLKYFWLRIQEARRALLYDIEDVIAGCGELTMAVDAKLCVCEVLPGVSNVLP